MMILSHRYLARIVLEAQTGLFVGSGEASLMKDALVQKDHNGWPMIQGTSLSGVLRHALEEGNNDQENKWDDIFGFQKGNSNFGLGSRLKISSAYMLINEHEIAEGLNPSVDPVVKHKYDNLPSRQHVRINERGVADQENNGLFDNEIVYKGTRFIFELELKGTKADESNWESILQQLNSPLFRIGQGTRNGYGKLRIHTLSERVFDLTNKDDFQDYLNFDPSFNAEHNGLVPHKSIETSSNLIAYTLDLTPDSFFIFSEGFGDDEVDNKPIKEEVADYEDKISPISFKTRTLIPASSIKGAIAHRTCFHYNKLVKSFADNNDGTTTSDNLAVKELFGSMVGDNDSKVSTQAITSFGMMERFLISGKNGCNETETRTDDTLGLRVARKWLEPA